jgi:hypothetical protein
MQPGGNRTANPAARSGDERDFPRKIKHLYFFLKVF